MVARIIQRFSTVLLPELHSSADRKMEWQDRVTVMNWTGYAMKKRGVAF